MFLNISNHPSSKWSKEQKMEASKWGEIADVEFPSIPASASKEDVENYAKDLLDKIMDDFPVRPDIVMIQGEMTFTYAMIQLLLVKGITSVAACSDRVSNEVVQADGTTKKVSEFKFVQFREY